MMWSRSAFCDREEWDLKQKQEWLRQGLEEAAKEKDPSESRKKSASLLETQLVKWSLRPRRLRGASNHKQQHALAYLMHAKISFCKDHYIEIDCLVDVSVLCIAK